VSALTVGVIGAGNAGQALAADLVARGHRVLAIYDNSPDAVRTLADRGGTVELVGPLMSGVIPLTATGVLEDAVREAEVLIVAVPATAHAAVAEAVAGIVRASQTIVVCPGYVGSTLLFRQTLRRRGVEAMPHLVETTTMPFAARLVAHGQVGVKGIKKAIHLAALPSSDTAAAIALLQPAFRPRLIAATNVLEAGFNNPNPIGHVPLTLMNWGRIEGETFSRHFDYHDWLSPGIHRVSAALDTERTAVMRALGLHAITYEEFTALSYDSKWEIIEAKGEVPPSSWTIPPRFLDEDIPCGLVPISSIGAQLRVPTPVTDALIAVGNLARARDFRQNGRTAEALGLQGLSKEQIAARVTECSAT